MKWFLQFIEAGSALLKIPAAQVYIELKAASDALITADETTILRTEKFLTQILVANTETVFSLPKGALDCSEQHLKLDMCLGHVLNGTGIPTWSSAEQLRPNKRTVYSIPAGDYHRLSISYQFPTIFFCFYCQLTYSIC